MPEGPATRALVATGPAMAGPATTAAAGAAVRMGPVAITPGVVMVFWTTVAGAAARRVVPRAGVPRMAPPPRMVDPSRMVAPPNEPRPRSPLGAARQAETPTMAKMI